MGCTRSMRGVFVLGVLALAVACDDDGIRPGEEIVVPADQLNILRLGTGARPVTLDTSFWAVRGEDRELEVLLPPAIPGEDGEEFLEFRVRQRSLLRRPDGSLFQEGDSVLIRVQLSTDSLLFRFEPSGLQFDVREPAELEIDYGAADPDYDGDGDVDSDDLEVEMRLHLWRQEAPGDPWTRLGTLRFEELDEVVADIDGFTGFALAGN